MNPPKSLGISARAAGYSNNSLKKCEDLGRFCRSWDTEAHLLISDVNAEPNYALEISDAHYFDSICDSNKEADFILGFSFSQEYWSEIFILISRAEKQSQRGARIDVSHSS